MGAAAQEGRTVPKEVLGHRAHRLPERGGSGMGGHTDRSEIRRVRPRPDVRRRSAMARKADICAPLRIVARCSCGGGTSGESAFRGCRTTQVRQRPLHRGAEARSDGIGKAANCGRIRSSRARIGREPSKPSDRAPRVRNVDQRARRGRTLARGSCGEGSTAPLAALVTAQIRDRGLLRAIYRGGGPGSERSPRGTANAALDSPSGLRWKLIFRNSARWARNGFDALVKEVS